MTNIVLIRIVLASLIHPYALGSVLVFQSTPSTVINGLTEVVRLRCSLNDTVVSIVGKRDITRTPENVQQVNSIIITAKGQDVATVSTKHPAKNLAHASNVQVTGDVSRISGERGFVEMTIKFPTPAQLGEYECEVTAVKTNGHGAIFNGNTEINSSDPTTNELMNEIRSLQQTIKSQQSSLSCHNHTNPRVRLIGGDGVTYGAVQLTHKELTGMLCEDEFERNNLGPHVVCRMLGFCHGVYENGNHHTNMTRVKYLLSDVVCTGDEADIDDCRHGTWGPQYNTTCNDDDIAGVRCSYT